MSKYFMDLEFYESGPKNPIIFISIGIVCDDGREYYSVSNEFKEKTLSKWLKDNVVPNLGLDESERKSLKKIKKEILDFIGKDKDPEFYGYYCDYDWVVFCQLFGAMIDLPDFFPKYCIDLKQIIDEAKIKEIPEQEGTEHNALDDAKYNYELYEDLKKKLDKNLKIILNADNEITRRLGLMNQKPIGEDECAFFNFPRVGSHSFWNKNVDFPISLIFCDEKFKVRDIGYLQAQQTSGIKSKSYDIKYVIEAHIDAPSKFGIKKGKKVEVIGDNVRIGI